MNLIVNRLLSTRNLQVPIQTRDLHNEQSHSFAINVQGHDSECTFPLLDAIHTQHPEHKKSDIHAWLMRVMSTHEHINELCCVTDTFERDPDCVCKHKKLRIQCMRCTINHHERYKRYCSLSTLTSILSMFNEK